MTHGSVARPTLLGHASHDLSTISLLLDYQCHKVAPSLPFSVQQISEIDQDTQIEHSAHYIF